ncbi:MAG: hypothetical protein WCI02_16245 [Planctomycetota bacterium]
MQLPDPMESERMSERDRSFESRMRAMEPAPATGSLEHVLGRIVLTAEQAPQGVPSRYLRKVNWSSFGSGACIGAIAASMAWFLIASLPSNRSTTTKPTDVSVETQSSPRAVEPSAPPKSPASIAAIPSTNGKMVFAGNEEGLDSWRSALSPISKQQWDRRRLEERGVWVSARPKGTDQDFSKPSTADDPQSIWWLRNGPRSSWDL